MGQKRLAGSKRRRHNIFANGCANITATSLYGKAIRTEFKNGKLGPEWVYIRNYQPENYTFASGNLRLKATSVNLNNGKGSPTFVGRRQEHIDFTATTSMQLKKPLSAMKPV